MSAAEEHRLASLYVSYQTVMDILLSQPGPEYIERLVLPAEIKDAQVLSVHDYPNFRAISFTLAHPTFAVVGDGMEIPRLEFTARVARIPRLLADNQGEDGICDLNEFTREEFHRKRLTEFAVNKAYYSDLPARYVEGAFVKEDGSLGEDWTVVGKVSLSRIQLSAKHVLDALTLSECALADSLQDGTAFADGQNMARAEFVDNIRHAKWMLSMGATGESILEFLSENLAYCPDKLPRPERMRQEFEWHWQQMKFRIEKLEQALRDNRIQVPE